MIGESRKRKWLQPRTETAYERWMRAEIARELGEPTNVRELAVFGGPAQLVKTACLLVETNEPMPERVFCNARDYIGAGLGRNGPQTALAIRPRALLNPTFEPNADPHARGYHRAILEPDRDVPVGTVTLDEPARTPRDPGRTGEP